MNLLSIKLSEYFETTAMDIYTILMDERRHASFTGDFVHIIDSEDEPFTLADGEISGKNVVLDRGKKIIWSFRMDKEGWPQNHYSEVAIVLMQQAEQRCVFELFHTAIPEMFKEELESFWKVHYFEPLRYYLAR